jgi:uncharacterized protein DUF4350
VSRQGNRRGALLAVAVAGAALLGVLWLGGPGGGDRPPLDPRSDEPSGTSALVTLLDELGAHVDLDVDERLDADVDVALVLRDELSDDQRADLEEWVRRGGTLVVSDPASPLTPLVAGLGVQSTTSDRVDAGICDFGPLEGLDTVEVYGGALTYEVRPRDESCFGTGSEAYVVATPRGDGTVVGLGGSGILLNRTLDEVDNAPVAAALLAPQEGTRVAVVDPNLPSEDGESLYDLVPGGVKRAIVQLAIAFLLYVAWRARRLGRPVEEPQPVKVAGSELVSAVGGLLERAGSPQHAADLLRADLRRDLIAQLGLPADVGPTAFAEVVGTHTTLDEPRVQAALGPGPVHTDQDLLAVAQLIDILREEVLAHVGT